MTLDSVQVQKTLYEQLLTDNTQGAEGLKHEHEALQLEKCIEGKLEDSRRQLEEAQCELCFLCMGQSTEEMVAMPM